MGKIADYKGMLDNYYNNKKQLMFAMSQPSTDMIKNANNWNMSVVLMTISSALAKQNNIKLVTNSLAVSLGTLHTFVESQPSKSIQNFEILFDYANICFCALQHTIGSIQYKNPAQLNARIDTAKISSICTEYLAKQLLKLRPVEHEYKKVTKTDIYGYESEVVKQNCKHLMVLAEDVLLADIDRTYGTIGAIAMVMSWVLGKKSEKSIPMMEELGIKLGRMTRIYNDLINIENDLVNYKNPCNNIILTIGIKKTFAIFVECKTSFFAECMSLELLTETTKDIIDMYQAEFDKCIEKTDLDLRSEFSSFT